jgi:nitronate monooxygenase
MAGSATEKMAIAVSKAGGLGQIGSMNDMKTLDAQLAKAEEALDRVDGLLPIGVGLLLFITKIDEAIPVLEKYKPAVVWLFAAPELSDYETWTSRARKALPKSQVWIQVGSVAAALTVAKNNKPDVLSVQGQDAGGHGFEKGAGVISMIPEIADALAKSGSKTRLVAAGGITEGRSAAAALMLGAEGVVMGTRFLASNEINMHPIWQKAVLSADDGAESTVRSTLFDNLRGPNIWPDGYDGRSIVMESYEAHVSGTDIEEIRRLHNEAAKEDHGGFGVRGEGRAAMWAGTGVGLVNKVQPAGEIVEEVRSAALKAIEAAKARL